jgi:predicted 3-demethylubiquinone-9 3-methyltransferase (glyoxalase superfamily)
MAIKQKITSNLWFEYQAEEAARYYTSIFKNSKIGRITHYGKEGFEIHHQPEGKVLTVEFQIEGQDFLALNGGPEFKFSEAISFIVNCETQQEIDYYWEKLSAGGDMNAQQCGWLKDKFGVSWQVVPNLLSDMLSDADKAKSERVMKALMRMKKLDIATFRHAYNNEPQLEETGV